MPQKYHFSDKTQAITAIIILLILLALSVFFCLHTKHGWGIVIIPGALYLIEWVCRANFGRFAPPGYKYLQGKIKQWRHKHVSQVISSGGLQGVILITSINDWLLPQYIQCCYYNNLSCLGIGTQEQLLEARNNLVSQYEQVKGAEANKYFIDLRKTLLTTDEQMFIINFNLFFLEHFYWEPCCKKLRELYPERPFTKETYQADCRWVIAAKIGLKRKLDNKLKELDDWEQKNNVIGGKENTPFQKEVAFRDWLRACIKNEGVRYVISEMTMMEVALVEKAYLAEIKRMENEIRDMKLKHGR
jgi:hypothetical protein